MGLGRQIASLYVKLTADITDFEKKMARAERKLDGAARGWHTAGNLLLKGLTLPIAAAGVAILKVSSDFDQAMRNVNSVLLLNERQFESFYTTVANFSMTTRSSAVEVANAFLNVAQAGFRGKEAFELASFASHAAGAAFTEADDMARLLITSIRAFNLEAKDAAMITDLFVYAMQSGAGDVTDMANSFARVAASANMAGLSLPETTGALTVLGRSGLSTAEAVTSLNNMLLKLMQPTEAMTELFQRAGYASVQAALETLGFSGVLKLLAEESKGNIGVMASLFSRIRALRGALILTADGGEILADTLKDIGENAKGALESAREQQYKSLESHMLKLKGVAEVLAITLGERLLRALAQLAETVIPKLVAWVMSLTDKQVKWVWAIGVSLAALGPLVKLIGTFFSVGSMAIKIVHNLVTSFEILSSALNISRVALVAWGNALQIKVLTVLARMPSAIGPFASSLLKAKNLMGAGSVSAYVQAMEGVAATMGGAALAAGTLVAGLAIVAAGFLKLKKMYNEGQAQVADAWYAWSKEQQAAGKSAIDIAVAYKKVLHGIGDVSERFEPGSYEALVGSFVNLFHDQEMAAEELNKVLAATADGYDRYRRAATIAGIKTKDFFTMAQFDQIAGTMDFTSDWNLDELLAQIEEINQGVDDQAELWDALSEEAEKARLEAFSRQLEMTQKYMEEFGHSTQKQTSVIDELNIMMGEASEESVKMRNQTDLVAKAFAAGLIPMEKYRELVFNATSGTLELSEAEERYLVTQLASIEAAIAYNELMEKRGDLFTEALGSDLAKLIEQHGQLVTVQASSVEETNAATIAALKAGIAYDKWQEALSEQVADPGNAELTLAALEAHNAYLAAADSAGELNNALRAGGTYTADMSKKVKQELMSALYEQADAAGASMESLVLLAAATGEWGEAEIAAALKTAALNEKIQILGEKIASGEISVRTATDAVNQLWEDMAEAPADQAFEVKLDLPEPMTPEEIADMMGFKGVIDETAFEPVETQVESTTTNMIDNIEDTFLKIEDRMTEYDWEALSALAVVRMSQGYTDVPAEQKLETQVANTTQEVEAQWNSEENVGRWYGMGSNLAEGILSGWDASWPTVSQRILGNIESLMRQAEAAGDIHSPSRRTAFIGRMLGEGLFTGFNETMPSVIAGMTSSMEAIMAEMAGARVQTPAPNNYTTTYTSTVNMPDRLTVRSEADLDALAYRIAEIQRRRSVTGRRVHV